MSTTTLYRVLIKREPHTDYQRFSIWDHPTPDLAEARATCARASKLFLGARIVSFKEAKP